MPIPQNTGSAWSYHWEPKVEHKLEPEKAKAPHTTISSIDGASLIRVALMTLITLEKTVETCGFLVVLKQPAQQMKHLEGGQNVIRKSYCFL